MPTTPKFVSAGSHSPSVRGASRLENRAREEKADEAEAARKEKKKEKQEKMEKAAGDEAAAAASKTEGS